MILLLATANAADLPRWQPPAAPLEPADAAQLSVYYDRRLRQNAELVSDWTVLQGGRAVPALEFAERVEDEDGLRRLSRHRERWMGIAAGSAAVGVAWMTFLTLPAVLGTAEGNDPALLPLLALTGPVVAAFPVVAIHVAERPRRARVGDFYGREQADVLIADHNRALAAGLGLDPAAVGDP